MRRYKNCTEYWLDTETSSFRCEFDKMYQDVEDPWGCFQNVDSLNNTLFLEILFHERCYGSILDVGSGLGAFSALMNQRNGGGVIGCDISATAAQKATVAYPYIEFRTADILRDEIGGLGKFDLVVFSEILWYILEGLEKVYDKAAALLTRDGILGIHQFFPKEQRYGREHIDGITGFETFISTTSFVLDRKLISYVDDGLVLLSTYHKYFGE